MTSTNRALLRSVGMISLFLAFSTGMGFSQSSKTESQSAPILPALVAPQTQQGQEQPAVIMDTGLGASRSVTISTGPAVSEITVTEDGVAYIQETSPVCVGYGCNVPSLPAPPPVNLKHSFLDTQNLVTFTSSAAALIGEANMSCTVPGTECKQVTAGAGGFYVAEISLAGFLHLTGHHTVERGVGVSTVLFHVARMVWISTHRH